MRRSSSQRRGGEPFTVRDLSVGFRTPAGLTSIVADVSLDAAPGEIMGIAGESGSGKTTAVLSAIGYLPSGAKLLGGRAAVGETSILDLDVADRRRLWATRISYVAQDAVGSLNPAFRIGTQLRELLRVHLGLRSGELEARARQLLEAVRLPDPTAMLRRYPHECSGGQLQRVAIALAIACNPDIIVLDEPTTGLDVTTQAEVVGMLTDLIHERGIAAIYISHDLALLGRVADKLVIFYAGEVVEQGATVDVLRAPRHPYTRALLDALPSALRAVRPVGLAGLPPGRVIAGACPFSARCAWAIDACRMRHPDLLPIAEEDRLVRCFRASELGPLVASAQIRINDAAEPPSAGAAPLLLSLEGLICSYGRDASRVVAVNNVSLRVNPGEVVALVGESGSGKSTIGRAIVGLVPVEGGIIRFDDEALDPMGRRTRAQYQAVQIIFQNPDSSLNPRQSVESLIARSVELFRPEISKRERRDLVAEALGEVQLDPSVMSRYPSQLSGGQKQRVAIARAFVARPRLIICDEIVSGQDVSVQATILELVRAMQRRRGTALLFISHDLAVVRSIAQRVYIIQRGCIIESGSTERVFDHPEAAYSRTLLGAVMEAPTLAGSSVPELATTTRRGEKRP